MLGEQLTEAFWALFGLIAGVLLPILRKWLKKMQRRCHRGHAEQETGIEMREIGVDVGGGERGQENAYEN